jgi:hypothetical protein
MRAYLRSDLGFERLHGAGITSRRLAVTHDPTGFWFETVVLQNSFADLLIGGEVAQHNVLPMLRQWQAVQSP